MLNDVLLLFDDLVLLRVVGLGDRDAGGDGGVQRADAVPSSHQLLRELQLSSLAVGRMLLACTHTSHACTMMTRLDVHITSSCVLLTLTQVGLEVWIDVHVLAPLHHAFEDRHQTLQTFFA